SVLAKYEDEPVDKIVGTMVAERSFDLVCLVLVTLLTYLLQMDIANAYVWSIVSKIHFNMLSLVLIAAGIIAVIWLVFFIYKRSKQSKLGNFIRGLGDGVISIFKMKKKG